jgi:hypothetical protein
LEKHVAAIFRVEEQAKQGNSMKAGGKQSYRELKKINYVA